ncbi:hypothetical protein BH11MYX1_BH11MYX1_07970 [soil metagenome]
MLELATSASSHLGARRVPANARGPVARARSDRCRRSQTPHPLARTAVGGRRARTGLIRRTRLARGARLALANSGSGCTRARRAYRIVRARGAGVRWFGARAADALSRGTVTVAAARVAVGSVTGTMTRRGRGTSTQHDRQEVTADDQASHVPPVRNPGATSRSAIPTVCTRSNMTRELKPRRRCRAGPTSHEGYSGQVEAIRLTSPPRSRTERVRRGSWSAVRGSGRRPNPASSDPRARRTRAAS